MPRRFASFAEFYPFYLSEHENRTCRRLHVIGLCCALGFVALACFFRSAILVAAAFGCGYLFAWVGHLFFEKNKPATFRHPLYSFLGDWVMFKNVLTGKMPF